MYKETPLLQRTDFYASIQLFSNGNFGKGKNASRKSITHIAIKTLKNLKRELDTHSWSLLGRREEEESGS